MTTNPLPGTSQGRHSGAGEVVGTLALCPSRFCLFYSADKFVGNPTGESLLGNPQLVGNFVFGQPLAKRKLCFVSSNQFHVIKKIKNDHLQNKAKAFIRFCNPLSRAPWKEARWSLRHY